MSGRAAGVRDLSTARRSGAGVRTALNLSTAAFRILVVDDEPAVAHTLRDYLADDGYDADVALNGRDGVVQFERKRPDVVLLDIAMPGMDGVEVLWRLKAIDATIPVVMVTANADETKARETRKAGAFDYVTKPFQLDRLSEMVGVALAHGAGDRPSGAPPTATTPGATARRGILIVDDDPRVSDVLRDLLSMKGFQARIATDAVSALREVASASPPDVVLLDINMPGLSGLNALPAIHQFAPRTIVILISGVMDDDAFKRARTYSAVDFFTKPIDIDELVQSIEAAFALGHLSSQGGARNP